jgi:hypothetical protein
MPYPVGHRAEVKRKIRDACTAVALQLGAGMKATNSCWKGRKELHRRIGISGLQGRPNHFRGTSWIFPRISP